MKSASAVFRFVSNKPRTSAALAVVALGLLVAAWQFGAGVVAGVRGALGRAQVERLGAEAEAAKGEAAQELAGAGESRVERKVEDRIRAEVVEPERARARSRVDAARERVRAAERKHEKAIRDPARDDGALRARNCAEYAELYPGRRRRGC